MSRTGELWVLAPSTIHLALLVPIPLAATNVKHAIRRRTTRRP
jgi:hypothetical protein